MEINCIIIDDELPAIQLIEDYVARITFMNVLKSFNNAIEPVSFLQANKVDVIFLDVEMEGFTGLQFIKSLLQKPKIILTTAYDQYALEAFNLNVCDYLLKPISFERFLTAINKCCHVTENGSFEVNTSIDFIQNDYIYIKENKKIHKIFLSDINYIESMKEYIKIHTSSGRYITKTSISNFDTKLPQDNFIRVHKSYIISISKIKSFTSTTIELENMEIPISRTYKNAVMNALNYGADLLK